MVELVYTIDLKSIAGWHVGSTPTDRTTIEALTYINQWVKRNKHKIMLTNVSVMQKLLLKITMLKHAARDLACVEMALDLNPEDYYD